MDPTKVKEKKRPWLGYRDEWHYIRLKGTLPLDLSDPDQRAEFGANLRRRLDECQRLIDLEEMEQAVKDLDKEES